MIAISAWRGRPVAIARVWAAGQCHPAAGQCRPVAVAGLWAADHLHVELFVIDDGAPYAVYPDHYKGVYILTEAIERDSNRIDVKVAPPAPLGCARVLLEYP